MRFLIGLGSNLDAATNIPRALAQLRTHPDLALHVVSSIVRSQDVTTSGRESAPPYLNGALIVITDLTPAQLKQELRKLEESLGRVRTGGKPTLVAIDLDLLLIQHELGDVLAPFDVQDLPMVKRSSLHESYHLIPAAEIAPEWLDPATGLSLRELANRTHYVELEKVNL